MKRIRYILIQLSKKNKNFRILLRKILYLKNSLKYSLYKYRKVDDKLILFESFNGRNYSDSPKALYEYMLRSKKFKDYRFVWCFENPEDKKMFFHNSRTILVKHKSNDYYKYFAISKYWIVNSLVLEFISKKKEQVYIQTWHGTPLKKLRYDIKLEGNVLNSTDEIKSRNDRDVKRIDYFLSPSRFATLAFTSAFNLNGLNKENIIIESGYPRNEALFKDNNILKIKESLGLPSDKKVILYAPTFRDNQHTSGVGYTYKLGIDFKRLQSLFSDEYVILFRTHYFISNNFSFNEYKDFIYNVSGYDDVNDLYLISDILITDYSSVFFDYANLKRPMLFYMYDLDLYKNKLRDFYIDINELPGPIVENMDDLISELKSINDYDINYRDKYDVFNKKYNYLDNKNASRNVIKGIFE